MSITKTMDGSLGTAPTSLSYLARQGMTEVGTITFDNSYPIGGELITFPHWRNKPMYLAIEPQDGYEFEYNKTNGRIKAFTPGKSLIIEETVTVSSHTGTLAHKPFYILAIDVTAASSVTGPMHAIPAGKTPLTLECAVDFTTGGLTFVSSDGATSVLVTYIPLHETGPFSSANLVVDEEITASATPVALDNRAAAVQYVYDATDGNRMILEPVGEEPASTGDAVVDIDSSGDTKIDANAAEATNTFLVTYIKYGTFDAAMQLGDADLTLASEIYNFTLNHYNYIAIPGLGTQCVGEASGSNIELAWSGPTQTKAAGVPVLDFEFNQWSVDESSAVDTLALPIIFLNALSIQKSRLEVGTGVDLSGVVPRYIAFGY